MASNSPKKARFDEMTGEWTGSPAQLANGIVNDTIRLCFSKRKIVGGLEASMSIASDVAAATASVKSGDCETFTPPRRNDGVYIALLDAKKNDYLYVPFDFDLGTGAMFIRKAQMCARYRLLDLAMSDPDRLVSIIEGAPEGGERMTEIRKQTAIKEDTERADERDSTGKQTRKTQADDQEEAGGFEDVVTCELSTVSGLLTSPPWSLPVIDADLLARKVVEPGTAGYKAIVAHFGSSTPDLLVPTSESMPERGPDGKGRPLNRPALGRRVFGDSPQARRDRAVLNGVVHPAVRREMFRGVARAYVRGHWAVVLDVPLLFEGGLDRACGVVVVVAVRDPAVQMARLRARDPHLSAEDAENRVRSQGDVRDKARRCEARGKGAGVVVWNDGGKEELVVELGRVMREMERSSPRWWHWTLLVCPPVAVAAALWTFWGNNTMGFLPKHELATCKGTSREVFTVSMTTNDLEGTDTVHVTIPRRGIVSKTLSTTKAPAKVSTNKNSAKQKRPKATKKRAKNAKGNALDGTDSDTAVASEDDDVTDSDEESGVEAPNKKSKAGKKETTVKGKNSGKQAKKADGTKRQKSKNHDGGDEADSSAPEPETKKAAKDKSKKNHKPAYGDGNAEEGGNSCWDDADANNGGTSTWADP
ncbi:hypothetical protein P8C59_005102 [Phyllachora maydis]|uniref:Uncharacterized protein n=1 Tax=Phyllachora maydis TaxID=1825666 RepID=A0AAD9I502_9PEZI|nr:hypothetical protein P8C59_005102 [Phyllachora maydis]